MSDQWNQELATYQDEAASDEVAPNPLLGYGPDELTTEEYPGGPLTAGGYDSAHSQYPVTTMAPAELRYNEVFQGVADMSPAAQEWLALDIYFNVPGAYGSDPEDLYLEDGVTLNPDKFHAAVMDTLTQATLAGPEGYDVTPMFLDILLGKNMSPGEITAALASRQAEIAAEAAGEGGGGRIINYFEPAGLLKAAHAGASQTLGRKATKDEAAAFVREIHGMQASGVTGMDVGALAEQAARRDSPVEAGAVDYSKAAAMLMKVIKGGR